ncbi:phenylalanine--tRNA ligase subunit beta [soil metagenome]
MNISYRWLRALAPDISETPQQLADRLGMLGAPVDEILDISAGLGDVVIARVESVRPHPNADRLRICDVAAGGPHPVQVVCGAPNVEPGGYYPFAPVGASIPGGMVIRKAKLRGEVSEGMLCSARELGLGRDHTGLMTLNGEWSPGAPFVEQLELEDWRLLVDITPNRPDLLSHVGVARELAPLGVDGIDLQPFSPDGVPAVSFHTDEREGTADGVSVRVEDAHGCRRYVAIIIKGVRVTTSPEWLATRLRAIGVRPINNVVDATNYILHELGQPLHAFDLDRLKGRGVRVRQAEQGETIRTLDGVDREISPGTLVIADAERPVALAGVMGGEESEVTEATTEVLLECALFDEFLVRRTARALGLSSDSSYRFERGVDPELQRVAALRALDLIVAVAGGTAEPIAIDIQPAGFRRSEILLRPARVERLLGVSVPADEIASLIVPIGFEIRGGTQHQESDSPLLVAVPGYRPDVTREIDLVEEIARRRGYGSFPGALPAFRPGGVPEDAMVGTAKDVQTILSGWGLLEARTVAFTSARDGRVPLLNPLSAEESHLRDELAPGLFRRLEHNWGRGARDIRLFEIGSVFLPNAAGVKPFEEMRLAVVLTGARRPPHWSGDREVWDIWDAKALLAELARKLEIGQVRPPATEVPAGLVMRESFEVVDADGGRQGWGGRLAASALDAPAWAEPVWMLELRLPTSRVGSSRSTYQPLAEFPGSERDLALLLPAEVTAEQVERVIRASAGESLRFVGPFDLYAGKGIPEGTRSVAWRLRFQRGDRTLTDVEVDGAVNDVLAALEGELDVRRR